MAYRQNNNRKTEEITTESGVKQGCVKSPTLFLIIVDWIIS